MVTNRFLNVYLSLPIVYKSNFLLYKYERRSMLPRIRENFSTQTERKVDQRNLCTLLTQSFFVFFYCSVSISFRVFFCFGSIALVSHIAIVISCKRFQQFKLPNNLKIELFESLKCLTAFLKNVLIFI